ncbi:MAG TPA: hypothetical protein VM621_11775 [Luteibacter sp.]|uniref:hypothetical protein n=1 Tax=Luteibacter sp. TaxID=1886636 RepID=UPI002C04AE72|nr:hypothetical protein [Luteibacter sp.]HVI55712.1 hypothetical protein [Luteibacter sp.]
MMHRPLYLAALVACLGLADVNAATPSPQTAAPGAPPPAPADGPPAPPGPPVASAQQQVNITGLISRFLVNPNGDVDGMLLDGRTQVTVPPPLGNALARKAKAGDRVAIDGFRIGALPLVRAASIGLSNGERLTDTPPLPPVAPPPPPPLQPMQANGRVVQPVYGPRGDVAGAILDNGPIVRVPPPAARNNPLLRPGAHLSAKGFGIDSPFGRAMQVTAIGPAPGAERPVGPPPGPANPPPPPTP